MEGILTEVDPERLRIGMTMRVTPWAVLDPQGETRMTYAFAPVEEQA